MFAPHNSRPYQTIAKQNELTSSQFTRNLYDIRYNQNGTGRDSYIYDNNGGLTIGNLVERKPLNQSGKMSPTFQRNSVSPKGASAIATARPIHYNGNGTGRDTYIQSNNGGFTTSMIGSIAVDPRITFKQNLRSYEPNHDYLQRRRVSTQILSSQVKQKTHSVQYGEEQILSPKRQQTEPHNSNFITMYQMQMNHQTSPSNENAKIMRTINASTNYVDQTINSSLEFRGRSSDKSPLSRELKEAENQISFQKPFKVPVVRYASNAKQRSHPISLVPLTSKINLEKIMPSIPSYNATQQDHGRMNAYINNLSDRLSIPKLNAKDAEGRLAKYLRNIVAKNEISDVSQSKAIFGKSIQQSVEKLERLQPTVPQLVTSSRNLVVSNGGGGVIASASKYKNLSSQLNLKNQGSQESLFVQSIGAAPTLANSGSQAMLYGSNATVNLGSSMALNLASTTKLMESINI